MCRLRKLFRTPTNPFLQWIIALAPFGWMRNDFQKEDCQGENPFAKGFSPWTLFPKTPILLRRKGEKWLIGAPAHDKSVRFQLTVKILEFLPEGSGPLGVAPTCIVRLVAFDTPRCCVMHVRRARSTIKSGFPKFSLFHPAPGTLRSKRNNP
jgi:hypothetical protein